MGRRIRNKRPSPATAISIVALVFAVAGTAVAGVATVSVLTKKEKKQTRSIAKDEIQKAAPGLSVANAVSAQNAASADALGGAAGAKLPVNINAAWDTGGAAQTDEPLGTFGALTVTGRCIDQGTDDPELRILLRNDGSGGPGESQIAYVETAGTTDDSTSQSVGTSNLALFVETAPAGEAEGAGVLVYNDNAQVTVINLRLFVEWVSNDSFCEIAGQATTTTSA